MPLCWLIIVSILAGIFLIIYLRVWDKQADKYNFIIALCAVIGLILGINSSYDLYKVNIDEIIPLLQFKPTAIEEKIDLVSIKLEVLNNSKYDANNISIDIKFGDHEWKKELWKVVSLDSFDKYGISDEDMKKRHESYLNHPTYPVLKAGQSSTAYIGDRSKEFIKKLNMSFTSPNGSSVPLNSTESSIYKESQGWKEDLEKMDSGQTIKILIRAIWENEIGRIFDRTYRYYLECTISGTHRSYKFTTGSLIEDN